MTRFFDRMERIRESLIRRAHMDRSDEMERGTAGDEEPPQIRQRDNSTTRLAAVFSRPLELLGHPVATTEAGSGRAGSPKSPDSDEIAAPTLANRSPASPFRSSGSGVADPAPAVVPEPAHGGQRRAAEHDSHRRRRRAERNKAPGDKTKRYLFCFPWVPSGRVRVAALHCFTSGLFMLILVAVYLGLSLTQHVATTNELTIIILLIILMAAVYFSYNIIQLGLAVVRGDDGSSHTESHRRQSTNPADTLRKGYAMPRRPIRVVLAQDEEAAGIEGETNKLTPPVYGNWRRSVRLDPNRLFWQRNETVPKKGTIPSCVPGHEAARGASGSRRPPSYASEDGVSYVMDVMATPRIITSRAC